MLENIWKMTIFLKSDDLAVLGEAPEERNLASATRKSWLELSEPFMRRRKLENQTVTEKLKGEKEEERIFERTAQAARERKVNRTD